SVTENERESDLGNLPRRLSVLGLGGLWDDWVRRAEVPPQPEPESAPESGLEDAVPPTADECDALGPVLSITESLDLTLLAKGPSPLPLADLTLILFFVEALSIHRTAGLVLSVTLPESFDRSRLAPAHVGRAGRAELTQDGFRIGLQNHLWFNRTDLPEL